MKIINKASDAFLSQLKLIAANIPEKVWTCDDNGNCTFVNDTWLDFTGSTLEENLGSGWSDFIHPEDRLRTISLWRKAALAGQEFHLEYRVLSKSGLYRRHQVRAVSVENPITKEFTWFGCSVDIEEHKRSEDYLEDLVADRTKELALANAELKKKNDALEHFNRIVAHDLKEPLRTIEGLAKILKAEVDDFQLREFVEKVELIENSTFRLQQLIVELHRLSSISKPRKIKVDPKICIEDAMENLSAKIEESKAEILVGPLHDVLADQVLLTQVFQNLLSNSIKFSQGRIPRISISACKEDPDIVFSILDNGTGIEKIHHKFVFDPFRKFHDLDETVQGTGIGLAIVKRIVELSDGEVWLSPDTDNGANFFVKLKAAG